MIPKSTLDQLAEYTEFHLESRYPGENKEFYEKCTETFACQKFGEIEGVYRWLIPKLKGTSNNSKFVTPVKTGVHSYQGLLDSGFRRNDIFRGGLKI